jgi:pimeloyl-ACP methyl ester carboxylesterase
MNPVSLRTAGVSFDNRAALPGDRIAAIRAPTLILHATDDTLQLYANAQFAAATIPDARLVPFDRGGHLLMVVEQAAIRPLLQKHILDHGETLQVPRSLDGAMSKSTPWSHDQGPF